MLPFVPETQLCLDEALDLLLAPLHTPETTSYIPNSQCPAQELTANHTDKALHAHVPLKRDLHLARERISHKR